MTRVIVDAATVDKLQAVTDRAELCDASGRVVGYFQPNTVAEQIAAESPFTLQQLQERSSRQLAGH